MERKKEKDGGKEKRRARGMEEERKEKQCQIFLTLDKYNCKAEKDFRNNLAL